MVAVGTCHPCLSPLIALAEGHLSLVLVLVHAVSSHCVDVDDAGENWLGAWEIGIPDADPNWSSPTGCSPANQEHKTVSPIAGILAGART